MVNLFLQCLPKCFMVHVQFIKLLLQVFCSFKSTGSFFLYYTQSSTLTRMEMMLRIEDSNKDSRKLLQMMHGVKDRARVITHCSRPGMHVLA